MWPIVEKEMDISCTNCKHCYFENWGSEGRADLQPCCQKGYIPHYVSIKDTCAGYNIQPNWTAHGTWAVLTDEEKDIFESGNCPDFEEIEEE